MLFVKQYNEYDYFYSLTHYTHGALICVFDNTIIGTVLTVCAFVYQVILQYMCDIRIYIPRKEIKRGHNTKHLVNKLAEYVAGFFIMKFILFVGTRKQIS
mgnify:CR=1 FL=1